MFGALIVLSTYILYELTYKWDIYKSVRLLCHFSKNWEDTRKFQQTSRDNSTNCHDEIFTDTFKAYLTQPINAKLVYNLYEWDVRITKPPTKKLYLYECRNGAVWEFEIMLWSIYETKNIYI